jgi:hypothetical protein
VGIPRESAVQVEPKVANILRRGNRNVIKEDNRFVCTYFNFILNVGVLNFEEKGLISERLVFGF